MDTTANEDTVETEIRSSNGKSREVEVDSSGEMISIKDGPRSAHVALSPDGGLHVEVVDESGGPLTTRPEGETQSVVEGTISIDTAPPKEMKTYTVIGTSVNHPGGYSRIIEAVSPEKAKRRAEGPEEGVVAVLEGEHSNLA